MKPELQAKFLQHLNKKNKDGGFTLIELLVVIIIIGILAAIALPSLLAQSNKARQSEARNNIGTVNRAQQAYYLEKTNFTSSFADLGVGIATQTTNYLYEMKLGSGSGTNSTIANLATPTSSATGVLKVYAGLVYVATLGAAGASQQTATQSLACEGSAPGTAQIGSAPTTASSDCPAGFISLAK